MRPNQQNKNRSRGRNNNGRKQFNPLSRNYESNGPDVKIRGNAAHIAEKYLQLARDAQATGDSVMAENYLQHAEHYFRILSAAQGQMPQRQEPFSDGDDEAEDRQDAASGEAPAQPASAQAVGADGKAPAEPETAEAGAGEGNEGRRSRRPRRRRNAEGEDGEAKSGGKDQSGGKDAGAAPQPDVGELPAFLTGGTPASAAE
jgi:hypothetical protein